MNAPVLQLEGTWEEVAAHPPEVAGRRVRLTVIPIKTEKPEEDRSSEVRVSTMEFLLRHAGTWVGNDLKECLHVVINSRSQAKF